MCGALGIQLGFGQWASWPRFCQITWRPWRVSSAFNLGGSARIPKDSLAQGVCMINVVRLRQLHLELYPEMHMPFFRLWTCITPKRLSIPAIAPTQACMASGFICAGTHGAVPRRWLETASCLSLPASCSERERERGSLRPFSQPGL